MIARYATHDRHDDRRGTRGVAFLPRSVTRRSRSDGDAGDTPRGTPRGSGRVSSAHPGPRCVATVSAVTRQRAAFTGTGAAVTANSGRVASGHGVAKYAMPPSHRCPVDVCSRHEHKNSVSDSPLSPAGVSTVGRDGMQPSRYPRTRLRSTVPRRIRSQAGPVQRRSALVHAPSSFRNKRHVPLGKKYPPSPNALIARPGGSNASAMDRPWPPGPSRTPRCAARNRNHAPSLPPGPRRPATPLRSGPVPPPPRTP